MFIAFTMIIAEHNARLPGEWIDPMTRVGELAQLQSVLGGLVVRMRFGLDEEFARVRVVIVQTVRIRREDQRVARQRILVFCK